MLLTDRPSQVLPTIASRCQGVRFDALGAEAVAQRLQSRGVAPDAALACARLSLGDGEKALALGIGDGPALRAHAEALARAPLAGRVLHGALGAAAQDRPRARPRRARERRVGARRGAGLPAQEGAQAPRAGVRRAGAARRPPRHHRRARPGAAARRPLVPRPGVRRRRGARARPPQRPPAGAPGGRRRARGRRAARGAGDRRRRPRAAGAQRGPAAVLRGARLPPGAAHRPVADGGRGTSQRIGRRRVAHPLAAPMTPTRPAPESS